MTLKLIFSLIYTTTEFLMIVVIIIIIVMVVVMLLDVEEAQLEGENKKVKK